MGHHANPVTGTAVGLEFLKRRILTVHEKKKALRVKTSFLLTLMMSAVMMNSDSLLSLCLLGGRGGPSPRIPFTLSLRLSLGGCLFMAPAGETSESGGWARQLLRTRHQLMWLKRINGSRVTDADARNHRDNKIRTRGKTQNTCRSNRRKPDQVRIKPVKQNQPVLFQVFSRTFVGSVPTREQGTFCFLSCRTVCLDRISW